MRPSASSGKGRWIVSVSLDAANRYTDSGVAKVTRPVPERWAPWAARYAAPTKFLEPAIINKWPKVPLCEFRGRAGSSDAATYVGYPNVPQSRFL